VTHLIRNTHKVRDWEPFLAHVNAAAS